MIVLVNFSTKAVLGTSELNNSIVSCLRAIQKWPVPWAVRRRAQAQKCPLLLAIAPASKIDIAQPFQNAPSHKKGRIGLS